jgi:hypothetical protein
MIVFCMLTLGVLYCAVMMEGAPGSLRLNMPAHICLVPLAYRIGVCRNKRISRDSTYVLANGNILNQVSGRRCYGYVKV